MWLEKVITNFYISCKQCNYFITEQLCVCPTFLLVTLFTGCQLAFGPVDTIQVKWVCYTVLDVLVSCMLIIQVGLLKAVTSAPLSIHAFDYPWPCLALH